MTARMRARALSFFVTGRAWIPLCCYVFFANSLRSDSRGRPRRQPMVSEIVLTVVG
jgi:hypothetical protein